MNLGDGLLLQLESGKPRLVLLLHGEKSGVDKQPYRPGLPRRPRCPPPSSSAPLPCSFTRRSIMTSRNSSKTPVNHTTESKTRAVSVLSVQERSRPSPQLPCSNRTTKTPANGRKGRTDTLANGEAGLKKGLACATNQQPTAGSKPLFTDGERVLEPSTDQLQVSHTPSTTEVSHSPSTPEPEQNNTWLHPLRAPPPALVPPPALATPNGPARGKESSGCGERSSFLRSMTALLDPAEREERERRRCKQLEQLRAIEAQLAERREQREREEEAEQQRKVKEQLELNDTWPRPLRAPRPSLATPGSHTPALATPPGPGKGEESSSWGERASFVRSMTALLDPAEREERERRRCKQLEQLRAIEAQLAQRREQREREELKRREEEEQRKMKEQMELNTQQGQLRSRKQPIREFSRSHEHVVTEHNVSLRGPKGGQRSAREPTCSERRGDPYQEFARTERTDTHRGLPAVRPPCPSSPAPEQDYFPYVRTADIIHLEPLDLDGTARSPTTNTHCQREILQSLAALRQGLLQKQRELETGVRLLRPVTSQRS